MSYEQCVSLENLVLLRQYEPYFRNYYIILILIINIFAVFTVF